MNRIQKKETSNYFILYQLVLYAAMISGYKGVAYYIAIGAICFILIKIFMNNGWNIPVNNSYKCFLVFIVFYTVTAYINFRRGTYVTYFAYYNILFFVIVITEYLKQCSTREMIIKSIKCFMFVYMTFCIIAIVYYLKNPGLARDMASHDVEENLAIGGGYFLAYGSAVMCVYLFSKMINGKLKNKLSVIIICAIMSYLVFLTESTITFLALIVGFISSIIFKGSEDDSNSKNIVLKNFIILIIAFICIILVVYNKYAIGEWILNILNKQEYNIIYSRITDMINNLIYGTTNIHVDARSNTLSQSIEIIKQHPMIGMGYEYGYDFNMGKYLGIGNHSEILDAFARYGIFAGCLWLFPYFNTIQLIFKKNIGCVITILIMMFFNPFLSFHSNMAMFFLIPLVEELINTKNKG